jgi:hypothetical protein
VFVQEVHPPSTRIVTLVATEISPRRLPTIGTEVGIA